VNWQKVRKTQLSLASRRRKRAEVGVT